MSRSKSALFNFSEVIFWVSVKIDFSDRDQRIVTVRNNLSHIENVELVVLSSLLGNKLDIPGP
jgi:hypothetical protein